MSVFDKLAPQLAKLSAYRTSGNLPPSVKLDANESPFSLPEALVTKFSSDMHGIDFHRYPDGGATSLRLALAERLECEPEGLLLGVGSDEVIAMLMLALRAGSGKCVALAPSFVMYEKTAIAHGLTPSLVPLNGPDHSSPWSVDESSLRETLVDANLGFYASPNNPSGNRFSDAFFENLAHDFPSTLHVVDEAYGPFAEGVSDVSGDNIAVMGTLSKIGFAGVRFGWVSMDPALAKEIEKVRQPYNINVFTQRFITLALSHFQQEMAEQVALVVEAREGLSAGLSSIPKLQVFDSEANFVLVRSPGASGQTLRDVMLTQDVGVRAFAKEAQLGMLTDCLRISVGTKQQNQRAVEALAFALDYVAKADYSDPD